MDQVTKEKKNFYRRIRILGYKNYNDYLKSEHWKQKKLEYESSGRLLRCLTCNDEKYILHHRSYVRLGDESLNDLIPLCKTCHHKIHQWFKENPTRPLSLFHKALRGVFGLKGKQIRQLLGQFTMEGKRSRWSDKTKKDVLGIREKKKHFKK